MKGRQHNNRPLSRRVYGASPVHLLLTLAAFALTLYAALRLFNGDDPWGVALWFLGAALAHDVILLPAYTLADHVARRIGTLRRSHNGATVGAGINALRVPAFLSGLLLLVWFPLILGRVGKYEAITGLSADVYLGRWLLITAVLFAVSALVFLVARWLRGPPSRHRS